MNIKTIELAINNILFYGDTDIFPIPIDHTFFREYHSDIIKIIKDLDTRANDFQALLEYINSNRFENIHTYKVIGYSAYRWVTLLNPYINILLLSYAIELADSLEQSRLNKTLNAIHSYRFEPDHTTSKLFSEEYGWDSFIKTSLKYAQEYKYIVVCDITDFGFRIDHKSLFKALETDNNKELIAKLVNLLNIISNFEQNSLPVGATASKILAEYALNRVDHLLYKKKIPFCRFVDDFYLYANTKKEAYNILYTLSTELIQHERLSLHKTKSKILTSDEFKHHTHYVICGKKPDISLNDGLELLSLNFQKEDSRAKLSQINIYNLLARELNKDEVYDYFSKRLLKTFNYLEQEHLNETIQLTLNHFDKLYPVFTTFLSILYKNFNKLSDRIKGRLIHQISKLFTEEHYITLIELNVAYMLTLIQFQKDINTIEIIRNIFNKWGNSKLIKSIIIQIMVKWKMKNDLLILLSQFNNSSEWERKNYIIASYILDEEGNIWRKNNQQYFTNIENIINNWMNLKEKASST